MSSQTNQQLPSEPEAAPNSGGVRRHHTITAASRSARSGARDAISEESQNQELWNDDEVVDEDWVGGVGAVGEKSSLHRQSSLPTRYHRAFQGSGTKSGTLTPKTMNSLTAIAGHDGDDEDWEREIGGYAVHDDDQRQQTLTWLVLLMILLLPKQTSGVRRHVSLTYGAQGAGQTRNKLVSGLKRSGTLQAAGHHTSHAADNNAPAAAAAEEEQYEYTYAEDPYDPYEQYGGPTSPVGRSSPWNAQAGGVAGDWRTPGAPGAPGAPGFALGNNGGNGGAAIDDVQRALSALELNNSNAGGAGPTYSGTYGQSAHPPRFNAPTAPGPGRGSGTGNGGGKPADFDGRKTPLQAGPWDGKERTLQGRSSNPNMQYSYHQKTPSGSSTGGGIPGNTGERIPDVPPIPAQYLQQRQGAAWVAALVSMRGNRGRITTPLMSLHSSLPKARYFVIKSYTEDDVHKSLKYEIWSSTDPGNKRLDKAFKECAGRGPIYLFYSVNASGHFCGMAEMLTPVDYTRSSTVWASDKWKGVFKVRWIFVRDIPNVHLRHIKLKPITQFSTQQYARAEASYPVAGYAGASSDAGQEMLRIFHTHPARTSLLQDFAFYEASLTLLHLPSNLQSMQKQQAQSGASSPTGSFSPQLQHMSPVQQQGGNSANQSPQPQNVFPNPNLLAYQMPQMTPLMQMQMMSMMGMGNMGGMGGQYAMQQSVMRNPAGNQGQQGQQQQQGGQQGYSGF
ncbi:hypothetical protein AAF712_005879 [Marasmius tenuissimus]|uniref:YTH domain-containing protein n=1 Tax=Marasmius tenuissimus TaxID=585030 RepID=A0ABR3A3F5_9AGAR